MATNKKKPVRPRKAAKSPVINLKATEVKPAKSADGKPAASVTKPGASQAPKKPEIKNNKSSGGEAKKPIQSGSATSKQTTSKTPAAKNSKKSLLLVSLAALIGAGLGGAWLFKEYGSKYFVTPNSVLNEQLAVVTERLDKLEKSKPAPSGGGADVKALTADLKKQIDDISKGVDTNKKTLATNSKKLGAVENSVSDLRIALTKAAQSGNQSATAATALQLKEMSEKFNGIEKSLAAIKGAQIKDNSGAVAELQSKIASLQTSLTAAKQQAGKDNEKIKQVLVDLTKKAVTPKSDPAGELARSFTILRAKVAAGAAFEGELDEFAKLAPMQTAIDTLRPFAKDGAPTSDMLKMALEKVSVVAPPATSVAEKSSGVLFDFAKNLSGLVKVSKVGETDWEKAKNVAVEALNADQIAIAIKALSHKNATKSVSDWLALAGKKLQIEKAIDQMSSAVMARLTKSK